MNISPENIKQKVENPFPFIKRMGVKALELKPRYVKLQAPLQRNENHIGSMYAGALFTLAEMLCGALYMTTFDFSLYYPILKEMKIQFSRPAKTDVTAEIGLPEAESERIEAEAKEKGKSEFVLFGEIKDESGDTIAVSKGVYQLRAFGT